MPSSLLRISMETAGVKQLDRALGVASAAVKNLRPVWDDVYREFQRRERSLFVKQGSAGQKTRELGGGSWGTWKPLDPDYAARKRAQGYGTRILVRTGRLEDSLTTAGHPDAIFVASARSLEMGTSVPYAQYHQTGTRTGLPIREPLRISESHARAWARLIQTFLVRSAQFERRNL